MNVNRRSDERVLLFADVVGSTRLYDSLGDDTASSLIRDRLRLLGEVVQTQHGRVVTEIGDELMCSFDAVADAAAAACEMNATLAEAAELAPSGTPPIKVRIGLNAGRALGKTEDLLGDTAKTAQWAAKNAKPEQILITQQVYDALPRIYRAVSRFVDDETWDFVALQHIELYELVWDVESVTACKDEQPAAVPARHAAVTFSLGDEDVVLNEKRPVVSVGRAPGNDLMIPFDFMSRQHFRAQFSRGRCTITDNSTNGTYVLLASNEVLAVRRETVPLRGSGRIYPGEPTPAKEPYAIHFVCR
ncbi:MAG: adenylate/guanylate cyclase domain-containing protein [Gammaproteobacteria bacterium]|nr:adenylate/guanylate cyclase domain-containing protein [Gammaproteobacteria bacterium]